MRIDRPADVVDAALEARIGRLSPEQAEAIREESALAFMLGMPELEALDVARGALWTAMGRPARCTAAEIVDVLAGDDLPAEERARLAEMLDVACATGRRRQLSRVDRCRASVERWRELAVLGWRLDLALEIVGREARTDARCAAPV